MLKYYIKRPDKGTYMSHLFEDVDTKRFRAKNKRDAIYYNIEQIAIDVSNTFKFKTVVEVVND